MANISTNSAYAYMSCAVYKINIPFLIKIYLQKKKYKYVYLYMYVGASKTYRIQNRNRKLQTLIKSVYGFF